MIKSFRDLEVYKKPRAYSRGFLFRSGRLALLGGYLYTLHPRPHGRGFRSSWNKEAIDLSIEIEELIRTFPKHEQFLLVGQMRRASHFALHIYHFSPATA